MRKMTGKREDKRQRFIAHCDRCGREMLSDFGWVEFQPKSRGTAAYMCPECMVVHDYHVKQSLIRWGTSNSHGFTYGFEFEVIPVNKAAHALLISRDYGMLATHDSSIDWYGGVEFKTLVYDSLNGVKQSFRTVEENIVFCPEYYANMGTHIHVGHGTRYTVDFSRWLYRNRNKLFNPLGEQLYRNPGVCESVFGRTLTGYADWPCGYTGHDSYINIYNVDNIEYRLPQFRNATQYFWVVCLCKEFTKALLDGFEKKTDPSRVGEKLVRLFDKHCKGLMNYQRPERNSKWKSPQGLFSYYNIDGEYLYGVNVYLFTVFLCNIIAYLHCPPPADLLYI